MKRFVKIKVWPTVDDFERRLPPDDGLEVWIDAAEVWAVFDCDGSGVLVMRGAKKGYDSDCDWTKAREIQTAHSADELVEILEG